MLVTVVGMLLRCVVVGVLKTVETAGSFVVV